MSKLLHSRVFRFLVCLILVAAFLVNLSPLKTDATTVAGALLSFEGLMAVLYSMGIGIVATELTVEAWNMIGQGLGQEIENADPSVVEAWIDVEALYNSYGPDDDDPEDALEWAEKLKKALSTGLLATIAGWLCTLVNMGGYEVTGDAATNYYFYNGVLLPESPLGIDSTNQSVIYKTDDVYYFLYTLYSSNSLYVDSSSNVLWPRFGAFRYQLVNNSWNNKTSIQQYSTSGFTVPVGDIIWVSDNLNYLVCGGSASSASGTALTGSDPTTSYTEIITPIYVGDIPQQIQDGEKDKDNLILPLLDPWKLIQSPSTALNDVNQMQQALKDGTTTLDQYLEQVTYQDTTTDPDPTTDPSESTTPSTGTDTEWQPPSDPGQFALDLTNVFPFCIPFDLYDFLTCLNADPVAPVIQWELALPGGGSFPIELDLSPFDSVAQLLRRLQLLLFCIGLAIKTRDLIKG